MNVHGFHTLAGLIFGSLLAGPALAQTSLTTVSPFNRDAAASAATAPSESYEFAAVSTIGKKTSVNIFDKQTKKGRWIALGESADGIKVKTYDAKREQVVVQIAGQEKVLTLRKFSAPTNSPVASVAPPPAGFNVAGPVVLPAPDMNSASAAPGGTPVLANPAATPAAGNLPPQPPPPAPGSVAHQEQEARMLVSDLLEIGMAQRKAYEEAQKKNTTDPSGNAAPPAPTPPKQ